MARPERAVVAVGTVAALCVAAAVSVRVAHGQTAPQTPQQPSVFRAGVNLVTVDAYPIKDGHVVEGLSAGDFQIFEDGKPQKIEAIEFIHVEPSPATEVKDPKTVAESYALAADPHNRVFVIYLDTHFVRVDGSRAIRRPLVNMLDHILAPNDLFGVMAPPLRPTDVTFGRKTVTVDGELDKFWTWGTRDSRKARPEGELASVCYVSPVGGGVPALSDPQPMRQIPDEILQRNYEDFTLDQLDELVGFMGKMREARTSVVLVTDGWLLYAPNESLVTNLSDPGNTSGVARPPGVGVGPGGKIGIGGSRDGSGVMQDHASCDSEMIRLARLDDRQRMRDLIQKANRNNVTFYAVNPSGLAVWDQSPATMTSTERAAIDQSNGLAAGLQGNLQSRIDTLLTVTNNTDGIAIVNTNDLAGGLKRIVDEVSSYYLLGYASTNPKLDGKYRRIEVKPVDPKIKIKARRGYTAGVEGDMSKPTPKGPTPIDDALAPLARLRDDAGVYVSGAAMGAQLAVSVELAGRVLEQGRFSGGGDVQVAVADAAGQALPAGKGHFDAGLRSTAVTFAIDPSAKGPWTIRATISDRDGTVEDHIDVARPTGALLGTPRLFRGTPSGRSVLLPVADRQYRRTERVHVEWSETKSLDNRSARLLGRDGEPLAVQVALTERDAGAGPALAADVLLGPLAPGDYLIEVVVGTGAETEKQLVPIRIVR